MGEPALIVAGLGMLTVAITLAYFRSVRLPRPPLGRFDPSDVGILLALLASAPYLYVALPPLVVSVLVGAGLLSTLSIALKPLIGRARWFAVVALLATDALLVRVGSASLGYAANDALAVLAITAIANVWAQSGMRARDAALLAVGLAIYDPIATLWLGLTGHLFRQISGLPFAPLLAWPEGHGHACVIGAGDVLVAALLPAVVTKAFGTRPGLLIALATVGTIGVAVAVSAAHLFFGIIPVMVGLGPVAVTGWLVCRHFQPSERTTYEYRTLAFGNQRGTCPRPADVASERLARSARPASGPPRPPGCHQTCDDARADRTAKPLLEGAVLGGERVALPRR
jgi:hypothetical protein